MSSHVSSFTPLHHCKLPLPSNVSAEAKDNSKESFSDNFHANFDVDSYPDAASYVSTLSHFIPLEKKGGEETLATCERYENEAYNNQNKIGTVPYLFLIILDVKLFEYSKFHFGK